MKHLFLVATLSIAFTLQAQDKETFASLDKANGITNVITVNYNKDGSVTINKSQRASKVGDQLIVANRAGEADNFWLVSFTGDVVKEIRNDMPTVECKCGKIKVDCSKRSSCEKTYRFGDGVFICKVEGCYDNFQMLTSDIPNTGGMLYIKATNVTFEN